MNAKQPTSWRDQIKIHPAAELFPMMTPDELKMLGEDIKQHWLKTNVAVWQADSGRPWFLLDGRNRLDAAELVGLSVKFVKKDGEVTVKIGNQEYAVDDHSLLDPCEHVISANIHRRHLTADQKRELIAKLVKATPEKSNRQIAEVVKASHVTVGIVRAELQSTGQIDQLTKTVGKDGKSRKPPTRTKPKDPAVTAAADRAEARSRATTASAPASMPDIPEFLRRGEPSGQQCTLSPSEQQERLEPDDAFIERCSDFAMMIEEEAERLSGDRRFQFLSVMRDTAARLLDGVGASVAAEHRAKRAAAAHRDAP
ncbi:hypothetical protein ACVWZM_002686 [Bradyrhizobium sp. USDA 4501]